MSPRPRVPRGLFALGWLLALSAGCKFAQAEDDLLYACEANRSCTQADQLCSRQNLCLPRQLAIRLLQPEGGLRVKGPTKVEAILDVAGLDPAQLVLTITPVGKPPSTLLLKPREDGIYEGLWTPSPGAGLCALKVRAEEAGLESLQVVVLVDEESPLFSVEVPPPAGDSTQGALTLRDPEAPTAWRRDERVTVRVTSDDDDVDPASVRLVVVGAAAVGDGRPVAAVTPREESPCDHAYCGTVEVDLSVPEMVRFRAPFKLQVTGTDRAGNPGTGSGEVQVTRWKWELALPADISTSLAIGENGRVYFGTRAQTEGRLVGVRPDGSVATNLQIDPALTQLAIGTYAGSEVIFLSVGQGGSRPFPTLIAVNPASGQRLGECGATMTYNNTSRLVLAAGTGTDGSSKDVAVLGLLDTTPGLAHLGILALRLGDPTQPCLSNESIFTSQLVGFVANGRRVFYSTHVNSTLSVEAAGLQVEPANACLSGPSRLALTNQELVAINFVDGTSNRVNLTTGACESFSLAGGVGFGRLNSPVAIDPQLRLFYGKQGPPGMGFYMTLTAMDESAPGQRYIERKIPEGIYVSPILGQGGWVYTNSDAGRLQVWTHDLTPSWVVPDLFGGPNHPTTIDCARDAAGVPQQRPGIWYAVSGMRLRAMIIDSRGPDTDAQWPMPHRDPRNTGDSAVNLKDFACP